MSEEIKNDDVLEEVQGKVYDQKQWDGLLGDKQKAIERARSAEAKAAAERIELEKRIKDLEESLNQKQEESIEGDPEDVATIDLLKKAVNHLKKEIANAKKELQEMYVAEKTKEKQTERDTFIQKSVEKARKEYTEEKYGKGLDFDSVLEGTQRMVKENPGYAQVIANAPNPGEIIYKIGLNDPIIAKRYEAYQKTLPEGQRVSKDSLEGTTSPAGKITYAQMLKMSGDDIKKYYDRIKKEVYGWEDQPKK